MIQRIQSLYLTLAGGLLAGKFAIPYFQGPSLLPNAALADGVFNVWDNVGLIGLVALGAIVTFAAVFLFRNRPFQARITATALLISALIILLSAYSGWRTLGDLPEDYAVQWRAGYALAPFAAALQWMALRGIRSDEQLIRSMDRLR